MQKLKTQLRRMIYFFKRDFLTAQNIVLAVAILLAFYFLAGAISATSKTWSLQTKLNALLAQEDLTKIEVEKLKLEQQYYQTDEYQELMARKKLGKMAAGETMVILEPNSKAASEKYLNDNDSQKQERSNFAQWLDLIF